MAAMSTTTTAIPYTMGTKSFPIKIYQQAQYSRSLSQLFTAQELKEFPSLPALVSTKQSSKSTTVTAVLTTKLKPSTSKSTDLNGQQSNSTALSLSPMRTTLCSSSWNPQVPSQPVNSLSSKFLLLDLTDRPCTLLISEWAIVPMINSSSICTKLLSPWIAESTLEMSQTNNPPRLCVPLSVEPSQLQQPSSLDSGWKILKSQKAWPFLFKFMLMISPQQENMSGQSSKQESDSSQWQSPQ